MAEPVIPPGYTLRDPGHCRSCSAPIVWCTTPRGAVAPLDYDGTSHFATCPQAPSWRKVKPRGQDQAQS